MLKVLVVAQAPPPYGGAPIMIERFLRSDFDDVQLTHVQMSFSSHVRHEGRVTLLKFGSLLALVARIIYRRFATGADPLLYARWSQSRLNVPRHYRPALDAMAV